ncbi:PREDICTED: pancreatic triacylglycerol lipase-like [Dufourea novaeangliae]|uniref:pancreatic triacylglycerol lipase-like n=1 Tax=Dufourea novaeangliae TaxID=178035 RepID=UPI0007675D50|nr:PREDICTED: pancreatic triacylglycerol lipase-like [Dufourea novaeangliae]
MKIYILISCLLACSANGYVELDLIRDGVLDITSGIINVADVLEDVIFDDTRISIRRDSLLNTNETLEEAAKKLPHRVAFSLYTRRTVHRPERLFPNDVRRLRNSHFDPKRPTKIIAHGWKNSKVGGSISLVRDAFLQHGDYNIIGVDWSDITKEEYRWAQQRVLMVGQYTAKLINFLQTHGLKLSQLTVIGHSLGGHVAGLAARYTNGTVDSVVALDPALPKFGNHGPGQTVSRGDAACVEVIHTNSGLLGHNISLGDIDFHPNGGSLQAGCPTIIGGLCSHLKAYKFYAESINSRLGFWAVKCNSYEDFKSGRCDSSSKVLMGGVRPDCKAKGDYYLNTNLWAPYAQGVL